jgi:hypothetical protein
VLHHFEAAEHVAFGVGQRLALLGREDGGQLAMFSRMSCCSFRKMRARAPMGVLRQVLKASLAEATAASSSACVAKGTRASTCWVAGLTMSRHSVVLDSTSLPPIKSLTVAIWVEGVVVASMGVCLL